MSIVEEKYCCDMMKDQLTRICPQHGRSCSDNVIWMCPNGTLTIGNGNVEYECYYCPWCGAVHKQSIAALVIDK